MIYFGTQVLTNFTIFDTEQCSVNTGHWTLDSICNFAKFLKICNQNKKVFFFSFSCIYPLNVAYVPNTSLNHYSALPIPLERARELSRIQKSAKSLLTMLEKWILALGGQIRFIWLIAWLGVQNFTVVLSGANAQSSEEKGRDSMWRKAQQVLSALILLCYNVFVNWCIKKTYIFCPTSFIDVSQKAVSMAS